MQMFAEVKNMYTFAKQSGINLGSTLGEMAEWSNAAVLKTVVLQGTGGSNPSLSAVSVSNRKIIDAFFMSICLAVLGSTRVDIEMLEWGGGSRE